MVLSAMFCFGWLRNLWRVTAISYMVVGLYACALILSR